MAADTIRRVPATKRDHGFTLVEMIVVITLLSIVGAMVAVFIRRPVESYIDSARRAEISDVADTALRRMMRDLRIALPNSVRVAGACSGTTPCYIEFLLTSGGGRYRAEKDQFGSGDPLDFNPPPDPSFDVLGPMPSLAAGDAIVIYNLGSGFTGADAYAAANNNRAAYVSNTATTITIAPKQFPLASPGNRFQVVKYAVTYACDPTPGVNELRRYWNYGITAAQQTPPAGGSSAQLARNVGSCTFVYAQNAVQGRNGVVSLALQLNGAGGERVSLYQESHVSNVP